jgi:hypothetical protein
VTPPPEDTGPPDESPKAPAETSLPPIPPLEAGALTHLFTAAQQSGLLANADAIIAVREREFRDGRYQKAFDVIEGLSQQLAAGAARRQGELRREELRYKSGALKMTPKEWLLRQRRATEQTQHIERARRQFARVLDGLNVLRAQSADQPPGAAGPAKRAESE